MSDAQRASAQRHFKRARKAKRYRSGRAGRKDSGAPTPTGVCLDDLIQEFADDQHGKGLIHTSGHSNVAGQSVQYGRSDSSRNNRRVSDRWQKAGSFLAVSRAAEAQDQEIKRGMTGIKKRGALAGTAFSMWISFPGFVRPGPRRGTSRDACSGFLPIPAPVPSRRRCRHRPAHAVHRS